MHIDIMQTRLHRITVTETDLNYIQNHPRRRFDRRGRIGRGRESADRQLQQWRADRDLRHRGPVDRDRFVSMARQPGAAARDIVIVIAYGNMGWRKPSPSSRPWCFRIQKPTD